MVGELVDMHTAGGRKLESQLAGGTPSRVIAIEDADDLGGLCQPGRLTTDTPLWLVQQRRLPEHLDFPLLFRSAHRRLTLLAATFGELEPDHEATYEHLAKLSKDVRTIHHDLTPTHWLRRSVERAERHPMRGLRGSVTYEGPISPFVPLLDAAATFHIGKSVAFGLGRVSFDTPFVSL